MQSSPEIQADVIYDGDSRRRLEECRVKLTESRLRFESRDLEKAVTVGDIFDVRLGQPPLAVAGEFQSKTLTVGVRQNPEEEDDPDQDIFFINAEESVVETFGDALYKVVLNGTEVAVRHPTEIGGRRTNSSFTIGTLHIADRSVAFTDIDVPFKVDIESIIAFSSDERELLGVTRDVIEVKYVKNGRSIVFEVAISLDRKHYVLGRYLRLEYSKTLRQLGNLDISPAETKALAILFTMHGEAKLQTLLSGRSESSLEVLKFLQKRGLVSGAEGYVRLTPKGWIIISKQFQNERSAKLARKFDGLTV